MGPDVHGAGRHDAGRRGLVAAGGEHDAVERIAVEHFDQAEIGEVAVERRRGPLAGLLDRVARELEGDGARRHDALAHALRELQMVAIARGKIRAGLCNADDRLARGEFRKRDAVVEVPLQIERRHPRIFWIVEPRLRAQPATHRTARRRELRIGCVRHCLAPVVGIIARS